MMLCPIRQSRYISLHAQCRAEAFYQKCGYTPYGEIDYDEGVAHIHMRKEL